MIMKNKFLELEYHHAFTQTGPAMEQILRVKDEKSCRETQTIELRRSAVVSCHDIEHSEQI